MNTTSDITEPSSQRNDTTNKTGSNESLHINTTTDTTSDLQYSIHNGNENGHTESTSVNTYNTTYPQSFSYQDWSGFIPQYVYTCIISMFSKRR